MVNGDNLYIRISEFGNQNPKGFTYEQIKAGLQLNDSDWEAKVIVSYMKNALRSGREDIAIGIGAALQTNINPNLDSMFLVIQRGQNENNVNEHVYIMKYDSFFNYIDYLELKEAYASSISARKQAQAALIISAILAGASILISLIALYFQINGEIHLEDNQIKELIQQIHSLK